MFIDHRVWTVHIARQVLGPIMPDNLEWAQATADVLAVLQPMCCQLLISQSYATAEALNFSGRKWGILKIPCSTFFILASSIDQSDHAGPCWFRGVSHDMIYACADEGTPVSERSTDGPFSRYVARFPSWDLYGIWLLRHSTGGTQTQSCVNGVLWYLMMIYELFVWARASV